MLKISPNLGHLDRLIRLLVGITLIYIGFIHPTLITDGLLSLLVGLFGLLNLVSSLLGWCLLYQLVQLSTRRT
jgi:hypothetical protein